MTPTVRERPILFRGEMVRAILDGRKTQTRRMVKPQPEDAPGMNCTRLRFKGKSGWPVIDVAKEDFRGYEYLCPYGIVGDRLWVRETWGDTDADHPRCKDGRKPAEGDRIVYQANPGDDWQWSRATAQGFCWRPSIHMPRWACRLVLEITDVRVERLQDISEADALAEGVQSPPATANWPEDWTHAGAFRDLWQSIHGKESWDANPWLWVIAFRPLPAPPKEQNEINESEERQITT